MSVPQELTIELNCPPGNPRPGDLIGSVIADSGLTLADFDTGAPFFGNQTWRLKDVPAKRDLFMKSRDVFKQRVINLYNNGRIRYGSW